jgi:RNA polymerase sigma-70 factor (ECF subfamily)
MRKTEARSAFPDAGPGAAPSGADASVFETVVLAHLDAAYTLARYLTRRSDAAEDIVQDALLRAYKGFNNYRGGNARVWLLTIVRNSFLTWNGRRGQNAAGESLEEHEWSPTQDRGDGGETPESILIQHETGRAIRALIEGLPQPFREILILRDMEDMSYREIAEITCVPIGTVMSRLSRARKLFAEAWKAPEMRTSNERLP